jgi:hypothetical protein
MTVIQFIQQFIQSMDMTNKISALAFILAFISFFITLWRYRLDQQQQRAAQTRQDLQSIIGDCNRFLRPLSHEPPYPILHTVTAIANEFSSRVEVNPCREKVIAILGDEMLLRSICVEGWITSIQIIHIMDIVEKVELKASSHNLKGKLLLIYNASYLLAGIIANICSPESFLKMLMELSPDEILREPKPLSSPGDKVVDIRNIITFNLQGKICDKFDKKCYKETIELSLYLIQIAANAFIDLNDKKLVGLARRMSFLQKAVRLCLRFIQTAVRVILNPKDRKLMLPTKSQAESAPLFSGDNQTMKKIKQEALLCNHLDRFEKRLHELEHDIDKATYCDLRELARLIRPNLIKCEVS